VARRGTPGPAPELRRRLAWVTQTHSVRGASGRGLAFFRFAVVAPRASLKMLETRLPGRFSAAAPLPVVGASGRQGLPRYMR
jgi:hypothetical protein